MKLVQFCVRNFRSIADTGWISASNVTALIGTNESGKSNILLALWKLKPVRDGEINLMSDTPRSLYPELREEANKPTFIEADFELSDELVEQVVQLTGANPEEVAVARVSRTLGGDTSVTFPFAQSIPVIQKQVLLDDLANIQNQIQKLEPLNTKEQQLKASIISALELASKTLDQGPDVVDIAGLAEITDLLQQPNLEKPLQKSSLVPAYETFLNDYSEYSRKVGRPNPDSNSEARDLVWANVPSFVYYANYGNLDSEIYLPHVIVNLNRRDLGSTEAAKARTLKVLFEFVKLEPQEILDLGKDIEAIANPTP